MKERRSVALSGEPEPWIRLSRLMEALPFVETAENHNFGIPVNDKQEWVLAPKCHHYPGMPLNDAICQ